MEEQLLEFGILNIAAQPHGPRTYRDLLMKSANREVKFWGDLNAAIREPREVQNGILQSEIVIGTELDLREPLIERTSLREISADDAGVRLSAKHLYNGRVFLYTFVEETHLLIFQTKNELGKYLSPNRAKKIFSQLFSNVDGDKGGPYVEVTVVPEDNTLERLLNINRIDRVEISLRRPNPADINPSDTAAILADLIQQGAKSQDIILTRASDAQNIELSDENTKRARVAQFNGFVSVNGLDENGERFFGSTQSYPKIIKTLLGSTQSLMETAVAIAKSVKLDKSDPNE